MALIHSLAMDRGFWRPVAERLDAAVLLYDCTGYGESQKPAGAGQYAKRAAALGLVDTTAWYGPDAPRQWEERAQKALD